MKSQKQRRTEIRKLRMDRVARQQEAGQYDPPALSASPYRRYADKLFTCRDCGMEQVWTAKQQFWWYAIQKNDANTSAVRCHPCRKRQKTMQSHAGANQLKEEVTWLRQWDIPPHDVEAMKRIEDALESKFEGVRKVAVDVLAQWRRPTDKSRLKHMVEQTYSSHTNPLRYAASRALAPLLVHPQDDDWVLNRIAMGPYAAGPLIGFAASIDSASVNAYLAQERVRSDVERLCNLSETLVEAGHPLQASFLHQLALHPSRRLQALAKRFGSAKR